MSPDGTWWWDGSSWVSAIHPTGRWRWTGRHWEPANQPVEPAIVMVVASGGIGCLGYGLMVLGFIFAAFALDNPYLDESQARIVESTLVAFLIGASVILGFILGRMNRRWWLTGPLIAAWPLYIWIGGSASYAKSASDLVQVLPFVVASLTVITITIVAAFVARRWGWPRAAVRPTVQAAVPIDIRSSSH